MSDYHGPSERARSAFRKAMADRTTQEEMSDQQQPPSWMYLHPGNEERLDRGATMFQRFPNGEYIEWQLKPGTLEYHPPMIKLLMPGKGEGR